MVNVAGLFCLGMRDIASCDSNNNNDSAALSTVASQGAVVTWPAPSSEFASADYTVSAGEQSIFVYPSYEFRLDCPTDTIKGRSVSPVSFCYFDLSDGPVKITVAITNSSLNRSSVSIVPKALGLSATVTNNEFSFEVIESGQIVILPGGEYTNPLLIFVNPKEENVPLPTDPDVIYYGPGHHFVKLIDIPSDKTLYIAGGAILEAEPLPVAEVLAENGFIFLPTNGIDMHIGPFIKSESHKNISIRGRGIIRLRKSLENNQRRRPILVDRCTNVSIEGIIIQESSAWNIAFHGCNNVHVDNVKIVSHFNNSDGIAVCGTSNTVIENSFILNSDDAFETKITRPMDNVLFNNNIAWSCVAASFGLASETHDMGTNLRFTNGTVLLTRNSNSSRSPISVHANNKVTAKTQRNAGVNNILFENIVVEKLEGSAIPPIKVMNNWDTWNMGAATVSGNPYQLVNENPDYRPAPSIKNIFFKNIEVLSCGNTDVVLMGDDVVSMIDSVSFENVVINGQKITTGDSRIKSNKYTSNINVINKD